jgi:5-methyltetrahydropteroyltriglutamate--homocysteine methyltransferase
MATHLHADHAPWHADHVGSLLRPAALLEARAAYADGRLDLEALRQSEDSAVLDAMRLQRDVGLEIFTDGEYRRGSWLTDLADAVEGFVPERVLLEWHGPGGGTEASSARVVGGPLRQQRRLTAHEVAFLKAHAPGPIKMTVPCPSNYIIASYKPGVTEPFYPTREALLRELTTIIRREVEALVAEGVAYVQLDAPFYAHYIDPVPREQLRASGIDPDQLFAQVVAADNACVAGLAREGVYLGLHVCRGNSRSRWYAQGGYEPIAERLFTEVAVDAFLLEYDSARAGGFEPLRFVPRGKTVVLGLITTKEARLESQDELRHRVDEAARYVPLEHLALSPQCGFASVAAGNLLSWDEQRRKLELVMDTARKIWG